MPMNTDTIRAIGLTVLLSLGAGTLTFYAGRWSRDTTAVAKEPAHECACKAAPPQCQIPALDWASVFKTPERVREHPAELSAWSCSVCGVNDVDMCDDCKHDVDLCPPRGDP